MTKFLRMLFVTLSIAIIAPVAAAQSLPGLAAAPAATPAPSPSPIQADNSAADDARLTGRIRAIFDQISALKPVQVQVSAGVVTLSGTVADQKAIDQAGSIAERLAGVVTVQNQVTRNLEVDRNLTPALSGVSGKAVGLWRALPLIGVAVVVAILVGMLGYFIAGRRELWHRLAPNPFLADLVATALRFAFVVGGIVLALDIVGATALLGAVLGGAGVIGIALGFAVRDSIDNYVSSLMLSVRQPFRATDHVRIDSHEGRVVRLTSRATVLMTLDGNHLRIPNSTVFKAVILNFSTNPTRRFAFDLTLDHASDPCVARTLALETLLALDFVLKKPEPTAEISEMPGTTQVVHFTGWVDQTKTGFGKARTLAFEAVRRALRDNGFVIPDGSYKIQVERAAPSDNDTSARSAPVPVPPPATIAAENLKPEDVAPEHHIERMVARERATDDESNDLLDASRPVE